jgi:hypothetical protein
MIFEKDHRLIGKRLFGPANSKTTLVIVHILIAISILLSGCEEKITYHYIAITKMASINNTYYEYGFPKPDSGDGCTWGTVDFDNSVILINQGKNFVMIVGKNKIEEYKITETYRREDAFLVMTKNNKGKECDILVKDYQFSSLIFVKVPYEPTRAYLVKSVDV